jgi:hypothetical protein
VYGEAKLQIGTRHSPCHEILATPNILSIVRLRGLTAPSLARAADRRRVRAHAEKAGLVADSAVAEVERLLLPGLASGWDIGHHQKAM